MLHGNVASTRRAGDNFGPRQGPEEFPAMPHSIRLARPLARGLQVLALLPAFALGSPADRLQALFDDAWEARLDSILLEDATVADLTVLVLDIPNQPDLGLLGMNFIRNFEMDIDNQKGQLVLRPR